MKTDLDVRVPSRLGVELAVAAVLVLSASSAVGGTDSSEKKRLKPGPDQCAITMKVLGMG